MGVRILSGEAGACLYCSTSDWCFGPLLGSAEEAELFADYLFKRIGRDPREFSDSEMESRYYDFRREFSCVYCGEFIEDDERCREGKGSDEGSKLCAKHGDKGGKAVWHDGLEWYDEEKKALEDHENEDCEPEKCPHCRREGSVK